MSLLSALVAIGTIVLAEHNATEELFRTSAQVTILSKIPNERDNRLTYVWKDKLIHYQCKGGVTYLVIAEDAIGRRVPFAFLQAVEDKFRSEDFRLSVEDSHHHCLQEVFEPELYKLMQTFGSETSQDPLRQARTDMNNVKDVMVQNIDTILSRGERLDVLVDRTDSMAHQAHAFRRGARGVRRQMWWKNTRLIALSVIVCTLLTYSILARYCGFAMRGCV